MSVDPNDTIIVEAELIRRTDKAILVMWKTEEVWLPVSRITHDASADVGQLIELELPIWLARDKGIFR
jgi:hypothetical protein